MQFLTLCECLCVYVLAALMSVALQWKNDAIYVSFLSACSVFYELT